MLKVTKKINQELDSYTLDSVAEWYLKDSKEGVHYS
jgi:hypothetical protein